jgi:hypothetical protein
MPAPIAAVGSMMVQGVFKGGSLLSGLSSMVGKFKGAQQEGKSTGTEMKRMTGHAHMLRNALALIGVGGFTALLTQTPALAGGLVKIKTEMMLIANAVGRLLKPSVDAVAKTLQGIRTGDWGKIKEGVADLSAELVILAGAAASIVVDFIWGEGTGAKMLESITTWSEELHKAWDDNDLGAFVVTLVVAPMQWVWDKLINFFGDLRNEVDRIIRETATSVVTEGVGETLRQMPIVGKLMALGGYDRAWQQREDKRMAQGLGGKEMGGLAPWEKNPQTIESQSNVFNIDMSGVAGNIEDPAVLNRLYGLLMNALRDEQKAVTY